MLCFIGVLTVYCAIGQVKTERYYFDRNWDTCDSSKAYYITTYSYSDTLTNAGTIVSARMTGQPVSDVEYSDIKAKKPEGLSRFYHENGYLKSSRVFHNGQLHGELAIFYQSGQLRRRDVYENGKLISGQCYASTGEDTTYFDYQVPPQYKRGETELYRTLSTHLNYPKKAKKKGITGMVLVKFVIDANGEMKDVSIARSVHPLLDEEALRVVHLLDQWTPGQIDGEKAPIQYNLPIRFSLR